METFSTKTWIGFFLFILWMNTHHISLLECPNRVALSELSIDLPREKFLYIMVALMMKSRFIYLEKGT